MIGRLNETLAEVLIENRLLKKTFSGKRMNLSDAIDRPPVWDHDHRRATARRSTASSPNSFGVNSVGVGALLEPEIN
jgi:hypothetical protein